MVQKNLWGLYQKFRWGKIVFFEGGGLWSDTTSDQRSPQPPEEGVLNCHKPTHRQTDGHGDSMTESAQWADAMKMPKA